MNKKNRTYVSYTLQMPKVLMSDVKKTARRIGVSPAWVVKKSISYALAMDYFRNIGAQELDIINVKK